jgi:hypothetical protein
LTEPDGGVHEFGIGKLCASSEKLVSITLVPQAIRGRTGGGKLSNVA